MEQTSYLICIILFDFELIIFFLLILIKLLILHGGDSVIVRQSHRVYDLKERVRPLVIAVGFYEISRISGINLDHGLISVLLE